MGTGLTDARERLRQRQLQAAQEEQFSKAQLAIKEAQLKAQKGQFQAAMQFKKGLQQSQFKSAEQQLKEHEAAAKAAEAQGQPPPPLPNLNQNMLQVPVDAAKASPMAGGGPDPNAIASAVSGGPQNINARPTPGVGIPPSPQGGAGPALPMGEQGQGGLTPEELQQSGIAPDSTAAELARVAATRQQAPVDTIMGGLEAIFRNRLGLPQKTEIVRQKFLPTQREIMQWEFEKNANHQQAISQNIRTHGMLQTEYGGEFTQKYLGLMDEGRSYEAEMLMRGTEARSDVRAKIDLQIARAQASLTDANARSAVIRAKGDEIQFHRQMNWDAVGLPVPPGDTHGAVLALSQGLIQAASFNQEGSMPGAQMAIWRMMAPHIASATAVDINDPYSGSYPIMSPQGTKFDAGGWFNEDGTRFDIAMRPVATITGLAYKAVKGDPEDQKAATELLKGYGLPHYKPGLGPDWANIPVDDPNRGAYKFFEHAARTEDFLGRTIGGTTITNMTPTQLDQVPVSSEATQMMKAYQGAMDEQKKKAAAAAAAGSNEAGDTLSGLSKELMESLGTEGPVTPERLAKQRDLLMRLAVGGGKAALSVPAFVPKKIGEGLGFINRNFISGEQSDLGGGPPQIGQNPTDGFDQVIPGRAAPSGGAALQAPASAVQAPTPTAAPQGLAPSRGDAPPLLDPAVRSFVPSDPIQVPRRAPADTPDLRAAPNFPTRRGTAPVDRPVNARPDPDSVEARVARALAAGKGSEGSGLGRTTIGPRDSGRGRPTGGAARQALKEAFSAAGITAQDIRELEKIRRKRGERSKKDDKAGDLLDNLINAVREASGQEPIDFERDRRRLR